MTLDTDTKVQVINNLTSSSTTAALSAAQGKILSDRISQSGVSWETLLTGSYTLDSSMSSITNKEIGRISGNVTRAIMLRVEASTSTPVGNQWISVGGAIANPNGYPYIVPFYNTESIDLVGALSEYSYPTTTFSFFESCMLMISSGSAIYMNASNTSSVSGTFTFSALIV